MENPFQTLGVDFFSREKIDLEVEILEKRLEELLKIRAIHEERFREHLVRGMSRYSISGNTLEASLNERFILGLPTDKKFFDAEEIKFLSDKIEHLKSEEKQTPDKIQEERTINQSLVEQSGKLRIDIKEYTRALEAYRNNPNSKEALEDVIDLYIKTRFEQAVIDLSQEISKGLPPVKNVGKYQTLELALITNPRYKELLGAYNKISTPEARKELVPEIYVLNRNADTSGIVTIPDKEVDRLLEQEEKYYQEWIEDRAKGNFPKNQNHEHAWGIVLTKPSFLMKDEPIDTPIFQGKISVECIGNFTEASLFKKVKNTNQKVSERRARTTIRKPQRLKLVNPMKKPKEEVSMRDRYYEYKASKLLYDSIYRVTKTDNKGITTTSIVFSPLTLSNISHGDVNRDFIKNVYFSDYMLDLAKQNGGYAGQIIESSKGVSISNAYSQDEIAAAILFDHGIKGSIVDNRGKDKVQYNNVTRRDFLRILNIGEREKTRDE